MAGLEIDGTPALIAVAGCLRFIHFVYSSQSQRTMMLNSGDAIIVVALVIVAVVMLKGSRVEGLLLLKG